MNEFPRSSTKCDPVTNFSLNTLGKAGRTKNAYPKRAPSSLPVYSELLNIMLVPFVSHRSLGPLFLSYMFPFYSVALVAAVAFFPPLFFIALSLSSRSSHESTSQFGRSSEEVDKVFSSEYDAGQAKVNSNYLMPTVPKEKKRNPTTR
uniref:Uncharacterized protein n=1 Tax=Rhodosorus marinus TaxID=101924 RepID=A0A7S0G5V9_9RHOD|mmetsp:Transcript_22446/g.32318  ORF Transcript_22446/g.32318 Transcript_22446/m.32318 type:complete len:148 (+) Transcript_22446:393-836(+)